MAGINLDFQEKSFVWAIYNFHILPVSNDEPICSPEFSTDSFGQSKFYLQLYTKSYKETDKKDYVSVYLVRCSTDYGPKNVFLKYELSLLGDKQQLTKYSYSARAKFEKATVCGYYDFMLREELLKFKKRFFIKCKYSLTDNNENCSIWSSNLQDLECLSHDLEKSLEENQHCDLFLRSIDGILFKAHKAVIKSRFPNLLKSVNTKDKSNEIKVAAESSTLNYLLKYIYSGKLDFESPKCIDYDALNQFDLPHLRNLLFPMLPAKFARTTVREKHACFSWSIPKTKLTKGRKLTKSFCCDESLDWTKIKLSLDVEEDFLDQDHIKFYVQTVAQEEFMRMTCKLYVIDSKNTVESEHDFDEERVWIVTYPLDKILPKNLIFSKNDILKIFFEFEISNGEHTSEVASNQIPEIEENQVASNFWIFQEDFKRLFKNRDGGDVIISIEKKKWLVHKIVLCARSPVFAKMFEHNMVEKLTGKVVIEDLKEPVFAAMMSYMYYGELDSDPKDISFAFDLYAASDKYEILQLRKKCIAYFSQVLDSENIGTFIRLANVYNDELIQDLVKKYVSSHVDEIFNSDEWRKKTRDNSISYTDLLHIRVAAKSVGPFILMTVLSCIYCEELDKEHQNIDSVIKQHNVAYRYGIQYLMKQCALFFDKVIKPENVGKFLVEAHKNKNVTLKTYVDNFVISNVHKIIRSDEWKKMMLVKKDFKTDMEKISLAAEKIDPLIVKIFLFIFYTGSFDSEQKDLNSLLNLYFEAEKYKLNQLKKMCTNQFSQVINEENIGLILSISEKYNDDVLKKCVKDFVSLNTDKILESSEWKKEVQAKWGLSEKNEIHQNIAKAAEELGPSIVMTLLCLIYCGKINTEQEDIDSVTKLYENAVKYRLIQLKDVCIFLIRKKISEVNVGKILILSNTYEDEPLRKCVQNFVTSNNHKILDSDEWKIKISEKFYGNTECVNIAVKELGFQIMMIILSYLYSGCLGKSKDIDYVLILYLNLEKYNLLRLKTECLNYFKSILTVENIGKIFMFSESHKDEPLQKCVRSFFTSNHQNILDSDEWKTKLKERLGSDDVVQNVSTAVKKLGSEVMMIMLSYAYCGYLGKSKDIDSVIKLYQNVEKYNLQLMKKECISYFESVLTIENVGKFLMLSDACKDEFLKKCVLDFVCSNAKDFLSSDAWKELQKENPIIIHDLLSAALMALANGPSEQLSYYGPWRKKIYMEVQYPVKLACNMMPVIAQI